MPRDRRAPDAGRLLPPTPSRADFHAHTSRSDGLLAPAALAAAAAAAGVRTLAVSDHDTLAGYRELVAPGAAPLPPGLAVLPAVEINATAPEIPDLPDGELHLIGLGIDPGDAAFEALLDRQRGARRRRFEQMIAQLRAAGAPVDAQLADLDRADDEALGRPTIARALVAAGHATDVPDAFARHIGPGRRGYVARVGIGPLDAIAAIRAAGGLAVLAHFAAAPRMPGLLAELIEAGLGGIEVHHRSFDAATITIMAEVAATRRLVPSGGTDYHGDDGTYADAIGETWIPDEVADGVLAALDGARAGAVQGTGALPGFARVEVAR
jgi:predicted metal-dependent phosphoesterase TrpH